MEEKLYFEPEKCSNKPKRKKTKNNKYTFLKLVVVLVLVAIVVIILWFLRGTTTVSGRYPENVINEALTCVSNEAIPPKINAIDSLNKEVKINAVFNGSEELKNISLIYVLYFDNGENAYAAEAKGHAEFNRTLGGSGYSVSKFSNKFARYNNTLTITLFANRNEIDELAAPYFMIEPDIANGSTAGSIAEYRNNYEAQGFKCKTSNDERNNS